MPDTAIRTDFRVVPNGAALGARVEGFDRTVPCDAATREALVQALGRHLLLVFPGAPMTPVETRDLAAVFGTPRAQLLRYKREGDVREVSLMVSTIKTDGTTDKTAIRSEDWHTDDSYFAVPARATLLHSIKLPSRGGATWFCNMHAAWDTLPEATRKRIDGMRAIHAYDTPRASNRPSARTAREIAETPDVEHPLVRTHPVTGRKALYLNFNRLDHVVGLERADSDALLDELATHARDPKFHFGHAWQLGDAVVWDNRATMHRVVIDYPVGEERLMRRVLIEGEPPF